MSAENATITATANDHLARYHHPHFISLELIEKAYGQQLKLQHVLFAGTETEPRRPEASYGDRALSSEDSSILSNEYRGLYNAWATASYRHQAVPLLEKAAPVWKAYGRARKAMDSLFAEFWETADTQWKAQTLKLTDTHTGALAAARAWDETAGPLATLYYEHMRAVSEEHELPLDELGRELGLDMSGWSIEYPDDYGSTIYRADTPLVGQVKEAIEQQLDRLRGVADLVGNR